MGVIVKDPEILGGTPVFRGTRVPVKTLFDYLEGGETVRVLCELCWAISIVPPGLGTGRGFARAGGAGGTR